MNRVEIAAISQYRLLIPRTATNYEGPGRSANHRTATAVASAATITEWDPASSSRSVPALHRVASDDVGERVIHRVTIAGDGPITAPPRA
jgi:hypothetical protein